MRQLSLRNALAHAGRACNDVSGKHPKHDNGLPTLEVDNYQRKRKYDVMEEPCAKDPQRAAKRTGTHGGVDSVSGLHQRRLSVAVPSVRVPLPVGPPALRAGGWNDLGDGARVGWWPRALAGVAQCMLLALLRNVPWQEHSVRVMGRVVPQPRLVALYADAPSLSYTYSGLTLLPMPWISELLEVRAALHKLLGADTVEFNTCLLNHYRDGRDQIRWHAGMRCVVFILTR